MTSSYPDATNGPTKSHLIAIKDAAVTLTIPESITRITRSSVPGTGTKTKYLSYYTKATLIPSGTLTLLCHIR